MVCRIWLTGVAGKLPSSARLDGLDISLDAAPLSEMLPQNVNLHLWHIKDDVPEHLAGNYDIVHVRFFAFVLQEPHLESVVDNMKKLLKPGGYLQWTGIDASSIRLEKIRPEIQADTQLKLMKLFQGNDDRLRTAWVPNFPVLLTKKEFSEVQCDKKNCPPHLALAFHECGLLATEFLARNKESDKNGVELLKVLLHQAARETRDGSYLAFTRYTVIGRKP
ncbi:unnamed protein product [Penicillium pancosmium]